METTQANVATGAIALATVGDTRTEQDFEAHVRNMIEQSPDAVKYHLVIPGFNTHQSEAVRCKLDYEYSASNYMVYCVVKDLDLRDYGFGKWNVSQTGHESLNEAFAQMYDCHDYFYFK